MLLALVFDINEDIIQVYNNKNFEFLSQNLIDIAMEAVQSIKQSKWYYFIFEMATLDV